MPHSVPELVDSPWEVFTLINSIQHGLIAYGQFDLVPPTYLPGA